MTSLQIGILVILVVWVGMLVYWRVRGGPYAGNRALDRKLKKARQRELNTSGRILNALGAANPAGMYEIARHHRSWEEGYTIEVRHHSKNWARILKITINCSLPINQQLTVAYAESAPAYHPLTDECVLEAIAKGKSYMNTLSL